MTDTRPTPDNTPSGVSPAAEGTGQAQLARPRRSYAAQVALHTFGQWGAVAGMTWIVLMGVLAVFAPFLANSHPYLIQIDGQWRSPLLEHLTPADVILLALTLLALVLLPLPGLRLGQKTLILAGVGLLVAVVALLTVQPPTVVVHSQWREAAAEGRVESVVNAPIPYSASDRQRDRSGVRHRPPSTEHLMGTDRNGADVLSRMIHASRIAMAIGFIATGIAVVIGVTVGGLMGYFAGIVDLLGMRLVEIFNAIPTLFLLIAFVAFFDRNIYIIMAIIGVTGWMGYAMFTRAEFLRLRQQDFVQAAIAAGIPLRWILVRHMLPNGMAPVLVSASFGVAGAILAESVLSFLGLGLVDEPSWGQMLSDAVGSGGTFHWWIALYPGLAIFLTVYAYNLIGESLRDAIDPHVHGGEA